MLLVTIIKIYLCVNREDNPFLFCMPKWEDYKLAIFNTEFYREKIALSMKHISKDWGIYNILFLVLFCFWSFWSKWINFTHSILVVIINWVSFAYFQLRFNFLWYLYAPYFVQNQFSVALKYSLLDSVEKKRGTRRKRQEREVKTCLCPKNSKVKFNKTWSDLCALGENRCKAISWYTWGNCRTVKGPSSH